MKIKNCFMDEQPDFYYKAEIDGVDYGTMRHLTDDDYSFIQRFAERKLITDKDGKPVMIDIELKDENGKTIKEKQPQYDYNMNKLHIGYLLCAFGGLESNGNSRKLGQEGWNMDRDCNAENIVLLKSEIKLKLYELIIKKRAEFLDQKEGISKN